MCICWTLLQNQCSWKPLDENDLPLLEQMAAIYKKKLALFRNAVDRYEQRQQKVLDLLNAIQHSIPDKTDTTQQLYELLFPAS